MNISDEAVKSGLFLRDLNKKEYLAELMTTLVSKERKNENYEQALKYTELILQLSPNSELGLVNKGALLSEIGNNKIEEGILSEEEKDYYVKESKKYIDKAISLGWKPESKEDRENYMKSAESENLRLKKEKR
jgi:tetratricopeptide (TPR) repeat protein